MPIWKATYCDSMTLWKRQKHENNKKISDSQGLGKDEQVEHQDF